MKLVTFSQPGRGPARVGIAHTDLIFDLSECLSAAGKAAWRSMGDNLLALIRQEQLSLADVLEAATAGMVSGQIVGWPENDVVLLAPIPEPRKIVGLAGNYSEHIVDEAHQTGLNSQNVRANFMPKAFLKPVTAVIGHRAAIQVPAVAEQVNWELELGVIIGRHTKRVPVERAAGHIAGYCIVVDMTACSLAFPGGKQPLWGHDYEGKWFDTFAPMGPYLVTPEDVPVAQGLGMTYTVNGVVRQQGNTAQMIFSVIELVAYLSELMTLEPGDLLMTGTPGGTAAATGQYLRPGDRVEARIDRLGLLANTIESV